MRGFPFALSDLLLAVEALSPTTARADWHVKRSTYQEARIPEYWIVDLDALGKSPIGRLVPISGTDGRTGRHYDYFAYLAANGFRTMTLPFAGGLELSVRCPS